MIQINSTIHTKGGLAIGTGSILDVKPHFLDPLKKYIDGVFEKVTYPISFDVKIYKDLESYKIEDALVLVKEPIQEFNIGYMESDVDIQSLTSVNSLLQILVDHIENGNDKFSGVGAGNTEIVYPTTDI